ncbi:MAG: S46 family peptidase [Bacteroidota bacterium]
MFKKSIILLLALVLSFSFLAKADEGMWLLSLLNKNYDEMKKLGFKLSPEDLYSVNHGSLKDAIGGLSTSQYFAAGGFFCTGEIISDQGLLLTNHHCGYDIIQKHSSVENDYLKYGFWAKNKTDELANEDLTVSFLIYMEDVTDSVFAKVTADMDESARQQKISSAIKAIEKEAKKDNQYDVVVKPMFYGNQYFLFVYETFKDVRLVGAPPESIGKFGSDTDNWMWPRHTGDFSMFRVYMSPDGKPAKYSKDNVPYKPKHHLPISLKGTPKGSFSMVLGFPGSTQRYMTSFGIQETVDISNPIRIKVRTKKLDIMKEDMDASDAVRIKLASKYAQSANYWKYSIGQNQGLKRLKVYDQRLEIENNLKKWINEDNGRKEKYGDAISSIKASYDSHKETNVAYNYLLEALLQGSEIAMFPASVKYGGFYNILKNSPDNKDLIDEFVKNLKDEGEKYFKDYNKESDKKILAELTKMYYQDVPEKYHLKLFATIEKKFKGDFNKYAEYVFQNTIFADKDKYFAFLNAPDYKKLEKDPAFILMDEVLNLYFQLNKESGSSDEYTKGKRLFTAALMEMQPGKLFYPNANSTIRLTYGKVGDYYPMDAVYYSYYTTMKGIMEKDNPGLEEFTVDPKLKELYMKKDYGRYADSDGTLHVCFTTDNDITGGNSGSPVINGNGELIGAAFDGNWEAMSCDIQYEKEFQKCINVDIRYVLFVIDKFAGATNLIDEMTIIE